MSGLPVPLNVLGAQQKVLCERVTDRTAKASLPVPNWTKPYWLKDAQDATPSPDEGSEGPLTNNADVCIIGSGISGVSTAYHLAQQLGAKYTEDTKVVILDARDFCSGATGRNGGHLTAVRFQGFLHYSAIYGADEALRELALEQHTVNEIVRILKETNHAEYVDLVAGGHAELYFTKEELTSAKADYEAAKKAGADLEDVEWFSKEEAKSLYDTEYPGARFQGNNLWPYKLVSLLYNLASKETSNLSLSLHTRTSVLSISPLDDSTSSRRWLLCTPRGKISCSYVVHATNAYVSHLLPHMHGPDGVIPTRGQVIAIRAAVPPGAITKLSWCGNEGFEYWFPRPVTTSGEHSLIILGGGREVVKSHYELYESDDSVVNTEVGSALRKFLPAVFQGLYEQDTEPEMEWTGIMGFTKSGDPFVGPVVNPKNPDSNEYEGQYVLAGFSGHGMPRAFACAEAVAEMLAADIISREWTVPRWLPRHYLTKAFK